MRERKTYFVKSFGDVIPALRNVQREHLSRVDDERGHASCDQQRDEDRGDRVETGPAVELDKQRRYDDAHRA